MLAPVDQVKVPLAKPVDVIGAVDGTCQVGPLVKVQVFALPEISTVK